jgi:hypothetical protein
MNEERKIFLFLGRFSQEGLRSKLNVTNVWYITKLMESMPRNWQEVVRILESPNLVGVVGKFSRGVYARMAMEEYSKVSKEILEALSRVPHIIFIHDDIVDGKQDPHMHERIVGYSEEEDSELYEFYSSGLSEEQTNLANGLIKEYGVHVASYQKNSELYVLADSFIEDLENNLLFRIYVPKGRLYSNETSRLLDLFRDWLTSIKKEKVRQDGYKTSRGQVFEFFSDRSLGQDEVAGEIQEFSRFLDLCNQPVAATRALQSIGVEKASAVEIVGRYAKEVRRLRVDIKQEREQRILQIRHQIESELIEESINPGLDWQVISDIISEMVPENPGDLNSLMTGHTAPTTNAAGRVQINQQIIEKAYGEVSQNIAGTQHFGADAQALIEIIRDYAGPSEAELIASVHEISDSEARTADRLTAKHRIKSFLLRSRDNIESAAFGLAQSYIESQMGL